MADKTYKEALAENELVASNPGLLQELITGAEIFSATSGTDLDSGLKFSSFRDWALESYPLGTMFKFVYDSDDDGLVNGAETIDDGAGNAKTAAEVAGHIDAADIHRALNDLLTTATNLWSGSKINSELALKADTSALNSHVNNTSNPHSVAHSQLADGGANPHAAIDAHIADITGNPHQVAHAQLADAGANTHAQIDAHIAAITGNPHQVTHAQVAPAAFYTHSQIDGHINSSSNPHGVTAAQVGAAPASHVGDTSHLSVDERAAMTNVNQPLTALNPFATIADLPVGTGHVIQDEGVDLPQRPNLNFVGPTVTVEDDPSAPTGSATKVTIAAQGDVTGPAASVDSNLAAYDGTNGKLLKDAGYAMPAGGAIGFVLGKASAADYDWAWIAQQAGGDVSGPASSGNTNVPTFQGTSGKVIQDSGVPINKVFNSDATFQFIVLGQKTPAADDDFLVIETALTGEKKFVLVQDLPFVERAPDNSYGYLREDGAFSNEQKWTRGARVFEQVGAPTGAAVGDFWVVV